MNRHGKQPTKLPIPYTKITTPNVKADLIDSSIVSDLIGQRIEEQGQLLTT